MKRALAFWLAVVFLVACGDRIPTGPSDGPVSAISDGAHATGTSNPDFFFLPPMVPTPTTNVDAGEFNAKLQPEVQICAGTGDAFGTRCSATDQVALFTTTTGPESETVRLVETDEHYIVNWHTDQFDLVVGNVYRVRVFVGTDPGHELGFADVKILSGSSKNQQTGDDIPLKDGRTLPIKFRIENAALCYALDPGFRNPNPPHNRDPNEPCASATLGDGGTLTLESAEGKALAVGKLRRRGAAAVAAGESSTNEVITLTMKPCPAGYLNPAFIDLPTFGDCVDFVTDPPVSESGLIATASMCRAIEDAAAKRLSEAQRARIVGHNLREGDVVVALAEGEGDCPAPSPGPGLGLTRFDRLFKFAGAGWQALRQRVASLLSPGPLWASLAICDRGCGFDDFESPVQGALPAKMGRYDPLESNFGSHRVNTTLPLVKVKVTDAAGDPVQGATLEFDPTPPTGSSSDPGPVSVTTGADGIAAFAWTLGSQWGTNTLTVTGRGIADPDDPVCTAETSGPCTVNGVYAPHHATGTRPVQLGTGQLVFIALGVDADLIVESLTHNPQDPNSLDVITFTAVVKNLGPGPTEASMLEFRIGSEAPGAAQAQIAVPALSAGQTFEKVRHATLEPGSYTNTAVVDVNNNVPEKLGPPDGELNNVRTDAYTVTLPPDLEVSSLTHSPANPTTADLITFTAVVKNLGPGPSRATTLDFRIGDETSGAATRFPVPALASGATFPVVRQQTLTVAQGYQNTAVADVNNDVPETNETNNMAADAYTVVEPVFESFESGIPASWTSTGSVGTSPAATNIGPTDGSRFVFLNTPGVANTTYGGTGGSTLESPSFSANAGDVIELDYSFLTTDGTTTFRDFAFIQLRTASGAVVATVGNANTTGPDSRAIPAVGGPAPAISALVTLTPATAFFNGLSTGPVGSQTYGPGKYGGGNGGSTGFVRSSFTIQTTGSYRLFFAVFDYGNRSFPSGLAVDNIRLVPAQTVQ